MTYACHSEFHDGGERSHFPTQSMKCTSGQFPMIVGRSHVDPAVLEKWNHARKQTEKTRKKNTPTVVQCEDDGASTPWNYHDLCRLRAPQIIDKSVAVMQGIIKAGHKSGVLPGTSRVVTQTHGIDAWLAALTRRICWLVAVLRSQLTTSV